MVIITNCEHKNKTFSRDKALFETGKQPWYVKIGPLFGMFFHDASSYLRSIGCSSSSAHREAYSNRYGHMLRVPAKDRCQSCRLK